MQGNKERKTIIWQLGRRREEIVRKKIIKKEKKERSKKERKMQKLNKDFIHASDFLLYY
jgi:hypothetical protein